MASASYTKKYLSANQSTLQHLLGRVLGFPGAPAIVSRHGQSLAPIVIDGPLGELLHCLVGQQVLGTQPVLNQIQQ